MCPILRGNISYHNPARGERIMVFGMFGRSDEKIQELIYSKQYDELPTELIEKLAQESF